MYPYTHQYIDTYIHQVLDVESVAQEDKEILYIYIYINCTCQECVYVSIYTLIHIQIDTSCFKC